MSNRGIKAAACAALALLLAAVAATILPVKRQAMNSLYVDAQMTLKAIEVRQTLSTMEMGIRYGKRLDNYFGMEQILERIMESSPYLVSAYVVDGQGRLLAEAGLPIASRGSLTILKPGDALFASAEADGNAYLYMDIRGGQEQVAGRLILTMDSAAMYQMVEGYLRTSTLQTAIVMGEALALGVAVVIGLRPRRGRLRLATLAVLIFLVALAAQTADLGLERARLRHSAQNMTDQSVQRIVRALQGEVDGVAAKGVAYADLFDVYGWLQQMVAKIDAVDTLDFDASGHVRATASPAYVAALVHGFTRRAALLVLGNALLALSCAAAAHLLDRRWDRAAQAREAAPARDGPPDGVGLRQLDKP